MLKTYEFDIEIPQDVLRLKEVFTQANYDLFLVGGCVRDSILGKQPKDFDLVTNALPDDVVSILGDFRLELIGKAFGIVSVITRLGTYEIATYRTDGEYTDGRRPDSVKFATIEEDAERRDLTINALYYDMDKKHILDYVGGFDDLENKVIRTVGDPELRFKEDKLRKLRTIRFASRFDSQPDAKTYLALKNNPNLNGVSPERIYTEFWSGYRSAVETSDYLNILKELRFYRWIFSGMKITDIIIVAKKPLITIALMLRQNKVHEVQTCLKNAKYTRDFIRYISFFLSLQQLSIDTAFSLKRNQIKFDIPDDDCYEFMTFAGVDNTLRNAFVNYELSVDAQDLSLMENIEGQQLGKRIAEIETSFFKEIYNKNLV